MSPFESPSLSVALLKSDPALSTTMPTPAAPIVMAASEIVSPANRLMFPSPSDTVTASLIVRSSVAAEPSAASVMLPAALFTTASPVETVNAPAVLIVMFSPPFALLPSVRVTPASESTVSIVRSPVFRR